ncbi:aminoglycoside phosphotransferase family protein [Jiangella aurantiaca]|uniref:Aminoglycoside phosphotransferase family protein n=1 Tax=Jiangella aurantiaca TaxID=2530373 RepID=A0A4R5APU5_9ACTN|nr:phosphotransferase [Jiangella aurantiaca]TDD72352.1 aminoglycoside phosphotransferase family protein [Jiangella aurantiaca]
MSEAETPLPGGRVGGAVRVGDTVRRPTGPWTPAVHALLAELRGAGLDAIPEVRGVDEQGREVLGLIPGRTIGRDEPVHDALLADGVRWLRRYHDAVAGYRPTGDVTWRHGRRALVDGEIICHNDPAAYNWIADGDRVVGVVDWDMAGPGVALDDLAFVAWMSVPLRRELAAGDVARRLRMMAAAYGDVTPEAILAHVHVRMTMAADRIEAGQRRGDPGLLNLAAIGEPGRTRSALAALADREPAITAALLSRPR